MIGNGVVLLVRFVGHKSFPFSNNYLLLKIVLVSIKMLINLICVRHFTIDSYVYVEFDLFAFIMKDLNIGIVLQRCGNNHSNICHVLPSSVRSDFVFVLVVASFIT